jgi:hypothetical protein
MLLVAELLITVFILLYDSRFFGLLGIGEDDGLMLSTLVLIPTVFGLMLVWARFVLKVHCPNLNQALLHPNTALKQRMVKLMIVLYLFSGFLTCSHYQNSLSSLFSISIILASLYTLIVVLEILFHMAKDERFLHPFR